MAFYYFSFQFLQFHYYLRTSCYYDVNFILFVNIYL